jgi:hypothetical protein
MKYLGMQTSQLLAPSFEVYCFPFSLAHFRQLTLPLQGAKKPAWQSSHACMPVEWLCLPMGHALHRDWPVSLWYIPASQLLHSVEDALEYLPSLQGVHTSFPELDQVPAGHALHDAAPLLE